MLNIQHTSQTAPSLVFRIFAQGSCCINNPQGTVLNSWNAVWVVLSEDGLDYYKKKTDRSPKGMIPLKGATLISPCQDFNKRPVRKFKVQPPAVI